MGFNAEQHHQWADLHKGVVAVAAAVDPAEILGAE
jgi:hypothetical protein